MIKTFIAAKPLQKKTTYFVLAIVLITLVYYLTILNIINTEKVKNPLTPQLVEKNLFDFVYQLAGGLRSLPDIVQVVQTFDNQNTVHLIVTQQPLWPDRIFKDQGPDKVNDYFRNQNKHLQFSCQLPNKLWLNYELTVNHDPLGSVFIIFLVGVSSICLIVFYGWNILRFTAPLNRLKQSADQLGLDINTSFQNTYGPTVIKETLGALYNMQNKIQELINHRTLLLASISHDLKAPITRAKLKSHFIENPVLSKRITADLDEMENMIVGILAFAQHAHLREDKKMFDLGALIATVCYEFSDMGKLVHIEESIPSVVCYGTIQGLKRCFINLIDNGIKYAGEVWVNISLTKQAVIITIEDHGPGVSQEELSHVFEPFYRARPVKDENSIGSGLGLSIVRDIIQQHQGSIKLVNRAGGGLSVSVELPLDK